MTKAQPAVSAEVVAAWADAGGELYNAEYEESGPSKHEIEDMRLDAEYEAQVVGCVVTAFENWEFVGKPDWDTILEKERIALVAAALSKGKYGWYRGRLPEPTRIRAALRA